MSSGGSNMTAFKVHADFEPMGDQPKAIETLAEGIREGKRFQTLMGVTGSGKTFTMAKLIEEVQKPTLVISHNKHWQLSSTASSRSSFLRTLSSTSSATTTTISRRHMFLQLTRISRRIPI